MCGIALMLDVSDKGSLARFLKALADDQENNLDEWQNISLTDYLRAIAAWIDDASGEYLPDTDWNSIAKVFYAGKIYE